VDLYIAAKFARQKFIQGLPAEIVVKPNWSLTLVLEKGVEVRPLRGSAFPEKGIGLLLTAGKSSEERLL